MAVELNKIYKKYKSQVIFNDFSLSFPENQITCILGPSGCGKTTLLNIISRTEAVDKGIITGIDLDKVSYIFQETRILPWKSTVENIDLVLKGLSGEECRQLSLKYLKLVGLEEAAYKYPHQLSGGMKQRVSIARAFAYPSDVILMDEPFKGLDIITKQNILNAFKNIWNEDKRTVIYVTHDVDEAFLLCDHLVIFSNLPVKVIKQFKRADIDKDKDAVKNEIAMALNKKAGE